MVHAAAMANLLEIGLRESAASIDVFPFSLPVVRDMGNVPLDADVTFFVGENGSGKSTILEAIAAGVDVPSLGGTDVARDPSLEYARALAGELHFVWRVKKRRGLFMRAEDFFSFVHRVNMERAGLEALEAHYESTLEGYGRDLAKGAARGQRMELVEKYGEDADAHSHGESFLEVLKARVTGEGLYLLDEPEAPLSPQRHLALMGFLMDAIGRGCQFIIATHSPILLALPGANILLFHEGRIMPTAYENLEHVNFTRDFLNAPERFLRYL